MSWSEEKEKEQAAERRGGERASCRERRRSKSKLQREGREGKEEGNWFGSFADRLRADCAW